MVHIQYLYSFTFSEGEFSKDQSPSDFSITVGLFYKNKKVGITVSMALSSFEDFEDRKKCLKALEKLYIRAIETTSRLENGYRQPASSC